MGWLFSKDQSKKELVAKLTEGWGNEVSKTTALAKSVKGNQLWVVFETVKGEVQERFIALFLLASQKGYGWGYKDMDEDMGPFYYNCPLKFLKMQPLARNDSSKEWREGVKKYWQKNKDAKKMLGKLQPGVVFKTKGLSENEFKVIFNKPYLQVESLKTEMRYNFKKSLCKRIVEVCG
jgi:hypothetical protein